MNTPTEGAATTVDKVELYWTALTTLEETGNTFAILSYNLEMLNSFTLGWDEVVGETSTFTDLTHIVTGLTVGTDYTFRIRA